MKIEFVYSFFACTNFDVDWNVGHSLSAGGPVASSAHLRLWGLPWTRYSRRSLAHPLQSTMFKISDRTPFAYSLFCFKIELLKLEVMRMLSKHHSNQRDQLEIITLDQLVRANHLVSKMEASIDFTFIYDLVIDMYSEVGRPSIDPGILVKL
jgi:hypothetical protein